MSSSLSAELEQELENELAGAAGLESELEQELAAELENEFGGASELELEHAQEGEHEAFFNSLAAMADRGGRSQALRRIAIAAARSALKARRHSVPPIEGEGEFEYELEALPELELEFSPVRQATLPGQMEHLGHAAAEASTEQEAAEHFLPLIGLAAKFVLPKIAGAVAKKVGGKVLGKLAGKAITKIGGRLVGKVGGKLAGQLGGRAGQIARTVGRQLGNRVKRTVPQLNRAVANTARTLWRNPATRPLVHAMPQIARRTIAQVARRAAAGRPLSPGNAVNLLARNTARTLANPRALSTLYRRSVRLDSRYHRRNRRAIGRPVGGGGLHAGGGAGGAIPGGFPSMSGDPHLGAPGAGFPGAGGGYGGGYAPTTVTGGSGCNCRCQCGGGSPSGNFIPGFNGAASPAPAPTPGPAPCPACGRTVL